MHMNSESKMYTHNLLWLDTTIHTKENSERQEKIRSIVDSLQVFDNIDQCEQYIQSTSSTNRFILIVSEELGQQIIPRIHDCSQISMIYIFYVDTKFHQEWSENYAKIKGIYDQFDELLVPFRGTRMKRNQATDDDSLSMSILNGNIHNEQSTSHLDGQFVHSQLLIDCLLRMETIASLSDKDDLISLCLQKYPDNSEEILEHSIEFKETYTSDQAIHWYTKETFVYRLLNKSLRSQDIDLLFGFRFLIRDIEQQLRQYQCSSAITLYRGQVVSDNELEILKQSVGNLISMNSFISTTLECETAIFYLKTMNKIDSNTKTKRVLFEIEADPTRIGVKPFASISQLSAYPDESEVLMMLGSVFRLNRIYLDQHHIWVIQMTLCSDKDHDLQAVVDSMKNQYGIGQTRLLLFGHVLVDMARFDEAEKYYHRLLKELPPNDADVSLCYHSLAKVSHEKGSYQLSLEQLCQSLDIGQRKLRKDHPRLGFIYTSMGEVYQKLGENQRALESYEKALQLWSQIDNLDPQYVAWCLNNIGNIYNAENKYSEALDYHLKAMEMKKGCLPPSHPCLGNAYLNIGNVYYHIGQYDQALKNYQKAKDIYANSLPPGHPSISSALRNIGILYEAQEKFSDALIYYKKAFFIRDKCFSSTHPDMIDIKHDMKRISFKVEKINTSHRTFSVMNVN